MEFIFVDTETYRTNPEGKLEMVLDARYFKLGCVITSSGNKLQKKARFFYKPEDMFKFIEDRILANWKREKRTYVFAHNHNFDLSAYARTDLFRGDCPVKIIDPKRLFAVYNIKKNDKDKSIAFFVDTLAFFPRTKLEKLGKMIDLPKLESPRVVNNIEEVKDYCKRDTEIVANVVLGILKIVKEMGYNIRMLTTANKLTKTCLRIYMKKNKLSPYLFEYIEKDEGKGYYSNSVIKSRHIDILREAYRGGRNEAFQIGYFDNVGYIDVNGLYSYVMMNMPFPNLRTEKIQVEPKVEEIDFSKIGIIRCKIQAPKEIDFAYLPIRYIHEKEFFPKDCELYGTWTLLEIEKALKLNYKIIKIDWVFSYDICKVNPIAGYITELMKLRREASGLKKNVYKMLANSLAGGLAQVDRFRDTKICKRSEINDLQLKGYELIGSVSDGMVMVKEEMEKTSKYANPVIASYITAIARDIMYENYKKIGVSDMLYSDTDSCIMLNPDKHINKFKISNETGDFKIEQINKDCTIKSEKASFLPPLYASLRISICLLLITEFE